MIVKDEEKLLGRCLSSVNGLFDEIVIVDTGSKDKTKQIARKFGAKVYDFKWVNDFSAARNFSFSKASGKYIMWLDADDVVDKEDLDKLLKLKPKLEADVYMLKYAVGFNELNAATFVYYRERILKNLPILRWQEPVHEVIAPVGKIEHLDITIKHQKETPTPSDRNLKIYQEYLKNGKSLNARGQFYFARELYYNKKYDEAIPAFEKFLTLKDAWLENKIEACINLSKIYLALNNTSYALEALFSSFNYDTPRAEVLCEIGACFIYLKNYPLAIYWLKLALKLKPNYKSGAFILVDCYNLIPHLQLCVCYYHLNKLQLSKKHNEKAYKINPKNLSVQINKKLFETLDKNLNLKI